MTARTLLSSALLCLAALAPNVALAQMAGDSTAMPDSSGVLYIWLAILVGGGIVSGIAMVAVNSRR